MPTLITAIIKRSRLDPVRDALQEVGAAGLTVCEVRGYGRQGGQVETYRGTEYRSDFIQKLRLDLVVADELVDVAIAAIKDAAATGKIGDGKLWSVPVDRVVRLRTGEEGDEAI
ncbi:MAG: P-II family nitrogen regulator [Microthrixaceae bacterium]